MENLKSLEGKKVRVFEATYNHSSFAAPICIAGKCTFVDIENGWIALDDDKIFNVKFLNRIEVVKEEESKSFKKKAKKEREKLKRFEKRAKKEAKKKLRKAEGKVETIIEKKEEAEPEKKTFVVDEKEDEKVPEDDFENDMGEDEEE